MKTINKNFIIGLMLGILIMSGVVLVSQISMAQEADFGLKYIEEGVPVYGPTDLRVIVARIIQIFMGVLGIIAVVLIIYGGFMWMTAVGNEERVAKAKKVLTSALIGLVIIMSAFAIVSWILNSWTSGVIAQSCDMEGAVQSCTTGGCIGSKVCMAGLWSPCGDVTCYTFPGWCDDPGGVNPYMCEILPNHGPEEINVTIRGYRFGNYDPDTSAVYFDDIKAEIAYCDTLGKPAWDDREIKAVVPRGLLIDPNSLLRWKYRKKISIIASQVANTNQLNFPVLIKTTFDVAKVQDDAGDILFALPANEWDTGTPEFRLAHEIESYDSSTGELVAWVKMPQISATVDTDIYMYYGNEAASNQDKPAEVWPTDYKFVNHLHDNPPGQLRDSTANAYNAIPVAEMAPEKQVDGKIDGSIDFAGGNFGASIASKGATYNNISISAWVYVDDSQTAGWKVAMSSGSNPTIDIACETTNNRLCGCDLFNSIVHPVDIGYRTWTLITCAYNGSAMKQYINGVYNNSENSLDKIFDDRAWIGNGRGSLYFWNGIVDEARLSNIVKSDDWIKTEYNNQSNPQNFYTIGSEETAASIPELLSSKLTNVKVINVSGLESDAKDGADEFTVEAGEPGPSIDCVVPNYGPNGKDIIIEGKRFGEPREGSIAYFKDYVTDEETMCTDVASWADEIIQTKVPNGIISSDAYVRTGGTESNGVSFLVTCDEDADCVTQCCWPNMFKVENVWQNACAESWKCDAIAENFYVKDITPQGDVPIRNVVPRIFFNRDINLDDVNNNISITAGGTSAAGIFRFAGDEEGNLSVGKNIEFIPDAACPEPNQDLKCLEANTEYTVTVGSGMVSDDSIIIDCSGVNICEATFTTGTLVDTQPPVAQITQPPDKGYVCQDANTQIIARATDDAGASHADFYIDSSYFDTSTIDNNTAMVLWNTSATEVNSWHKLKAIAYDFDYNKAESKEISVQVLAAHCCNGTKDADESAVDCGGADCRACDGGWCHFGAEGDFDEEGNLIEGAQCNPQNEMCRSLFCGTVDCKCKSQPIITEVTPDNGYARTLVTIWGDNFGEPFKYFANNKYAPYDNFDQDADLQAWRTIVRSGASAIAPIFKDDERMRIDISGQSETRDIYLINNASHFTYPTIKKTDLYKYKFKAEATEDLEIHIDGYINNGSVRLFRFYSTIDTSEREYQFIIDPGSYSEMVSDETDLRIYIYLGGIQGGIWLDDISFDKLDGRVVFMGKPDQGVQDVNAAFPSKSLPTSYCVDTWKDNYIVVSVPTGLAVGTSWPIRVYSNYDLNVYDDTTIDTADAGSLVIDFSVNTVLHPGLCYIEPGQGVFGYDFEVRGNNFRTDTSDIVFGGGEQIKSASEVAFISAATGSGKVPNIVRGDNVVRVYNPRANEGYSNSMEFYVGAILGPEITIDYINPERGGVGQYVTIFGKGFGDSEGRVNFIDQGGVSTSADTDFPDYCESTDYWNDNFIIVKVPNIDLGDYKVSVTRSDGAVSDNMADFSVTQDPPTPGLCKISPDNGPVGVLTNLYGEFLNKEDADLENDNIRFWPYDTAGNSINSWANQTWTDEKVENIPVPVTAQTGPVRAIVDGTLSNEVLFDVGYCTNESCEARGQVCCTPGSDYEGSCMDTLDECVVAAPECTYQWAFSTGKLLRPVPVVVDNCQCDESPQSPSPRDTKSDCAQSAQNFCVNGAISARFTTEMNKTALKDRNNILLQPCLLETGEKDLDGDCRFLGNPVSGLISIYSYKYPINDSTITEDGFILYPKQELDPDTWYNVRLIGGALGLKSKYNVPLGGFTEFYEYRWKFKTSDQRCVPTKVDVQPTSTILNSTVHNPTDGLFAKDTFTAFARNDECYVIANINWNFNFEPQQADNAVTNTSIATDCVSKCEGAGCNPLCLYDYCCLSTDQVEATAVAEGTDKVAAIPAKYQNITDFGYAHVDFSLFKVVSYEPSCDSACGNAAIRFGFNRAADPITVTPSTVMLFECDAKTNPRCNINYPDANMVGISGVDDISTGASTAFKINLGGSDLNLGSLYRVVLSPTKLNIDNNIITSEIMSNPRLGSSVRESALELRNDLDGNGELDSFSWTFFVGKDYCYPYRTYVLPTPYTYKTTDPKTFAGYVKSAPDDCNPNGNELDQDRYYWQWDITDNNIIDFADSLDLYYQRSISPNNEGNTEVRSWTVSDTIRNEDVSSYVNIKQPANVGVAYSSLTVVDRWPDCFTACSNAYVGARFNIEPMAGRINKDYIKVYDCGKTCEGTADLCDVNEDCAEGVNCVDDCSMVNSATAGDFAVPEEDYYINRTEKEFEIATPAGKEFDTSKRHKVVIFGINPEDLGADNPDFGVIGRSGQPLGGLNNDFDNDGSFDSYAWEFAYKEDKVCIMSRAEVVPIATILYAIEAEELLRTHAFTDPDECSEDGQRLKAEKYSWAWTRSKDVVSLIQPYLRWYDEIAQEEMRTALTTSNYKGVMSEYYDLTGTGYCENNYNLACENDIDCGSQKICLKTKNTGSEITCSTNADCGTYCSNDIDIACENDEGCKVCSNNPKTPCIDDGDCQGGATCVVGGRCNVVKDRCDYRNNCIGGNTAIVNAAADNEKAEQIVGTGYASVVCGFEDDNQCMAKNDITYGLGTDTCCYKRPVIEGTIPLDIEEYPDDPLANNVCRNAAILVNFDQQVTSGSLLNNVILEANFGTDPCAAAETYKTYNSATPEWYDNLNNLRIDTISKKMVLSEGQTTGTWKVFYDSEIINNIWRKITWKGYVPVNPGAGLDTSINIRARSAGQATVEADPATGRQTITGLTDVGDEDWINVLPSASPYALSFDRDGDYIVINDSDSLDSISGQIAISLWINWDGVRNWNRLVSKGFYGDGNQGSFMARLNDDGKAVFSFQNTSNEWCDLYSSKPITPSEWTHLAFTYNSTEGKSKLYINGSLDSSADCSGPIIASDLNLGIAASFISNDVNNPQNLFGGVMDGILIYNRSLSGNEIKNLYNSQNVIDGLISFWSFDNKTAEDVWGGNNGTISGNPRFVSAQDRPNVENANDNISALPNNRYIEVEITLNTTDAEISPQLDYLTIKSGGTVGEETALRKAIRFVKNIFLKPMRWIGRIFGIEAWAQAGNWCPVNIITNESSTSKVIGKFCRGGANAGISCDGNETVCAVDGGKCVERYKLYSKVSVSPTSLLDPLRIYRVTLYGQDQTDPQKGIISARGVKMRQDYDFSFLTSSEVCTINKLEVNVFPPGLPIKNDLFSCSGDTCADDMCCPPDQPDCGCGSMTGVQHKYQTFVKDQRGFYLQSYPGAPIYYLWEEIDPRRAIGITDATLEAFPSVKSCDNLQAILKETIIGEDGSSHAIYTTGCPHESETAGIKVTAYDGDPDNVPDIGRASETIDITVAMCYNPINWSDEDYNFKTNYCRDSGTPEDVSDDLPILDIIEITP